MFILLLLNNKYTIQSSPQFLLRTDGQTEPLALIYTSPASLNRTTQRLHDNPHAPVALIKYDTTKSRKLFLYV